VNVYGDECFPPVEEPVGRELWVRGVIISISSGTNMP